MMIALNKDKHDANDFDIVLNQVEPTRKLQGSVWKDPDGMFVVLQTSSVFYAMISVDKNGRIATNRWQSSHYPSGCWKKFELIEWLNNAKATYVGQYYTLYGELDETP